MFLLIPAYIVLNGLFYLVFSYFPNIEWLTIVSYIILIGTIMYKRYKPISQEEQMADYSVLSYYLQSNRWEILQDNHSYTIIRPIFDTPLNLIIDNKVTIEKNRNSVQISGPQLYVTDIFKYLHNSDDEKINTWFKPIRLAFTAVILAMPFVNDSGLIWEWTVLRHNVMSSNMETDTFNGLYKSNSVTNLNNHGLGLDGENHSIYFYDHQTLVKTDDELNFLETIPFPQSSYDYGNLNMAGDWLYFTNDESLNRMKTDGSNIETLFDYGYVTSVHLTEKGLFFLNGADYFKVYRMDLNGRKLERVVNVDHIFDLSVYEDGLYVSHQDGIDRYSLDGEFSARLSDAQAWSLTKQSNYYYFIGEDQRLYRLSETKPDQTEVLIDAPINYYILTESKIVYMTDSYSPKHRYNGVYKANLEGDEIERLYVTDSIRHLTRIGDSVIFDASGVYGAVDVRRYDLNKDTVEPLYNNY